MTKKKRSFSLKSGTIENEGFRRCTQAQCDFYVNGSCKNCETCGSSPFILDKSCGRCFSCENIPNELRFGSDKVKQKIAIPKPVPVEQEMVIKAMKKTIGKEEELLIQ